MSHDRRVEALERALMRATLSHHLQHVRPLGPSWDDCEDPLCVDGKRLLPALRATTDASASSSDPARVMVWSRRTNGSRS